MPDKFAIRVTCTSCGKNDLLASNEDKAIPLLFDTPEEAHAHIRDISVRKQGTFNNPDPNPLYECPNPACGIISPMFRLRFDALRYQSKS